MELGGIFGVLVTVIGGGLGTYAATELVKASDRIDIWQGDTTKIRAVVALLSVATVVVSGVLQKDLAPESVQDFMVKAVELVGVFYLAHKTHKSVDPK